MDKLRRASDLMQKGFLLLDEHRYAEAMKVGQKLKRLRHSSAFEILALAYRRSDKLSKAIAVLEEGVAKAGRVWILWELLGNCYSDAAHFAKAEKAYQAALLRESSDQAVVHLNRAIAFNRAGKPAEAKSVLRLVKSPRLLWWTEACRIRTALALGNTRLARRLALGLCRRRSSVFESCDRESKSEVFLACALALKGKAETHSKALRLAFRAVDAQPNNAQALAAIRDIIQRKVASPLLFRLLIRGVWGAPIDKSRVPPGFFRTVEVAAASQQAALRYARPFFPKRVRESLSVEETKAFRSTALSLEGVYFVSGYVFYLRRGKA